MASSKSPTPNWDRIRDVTLDSRQVREGTLFLALPGRRVDGAAFAKDAAKQGATAILLDAKTDARLIPYGPEILLSDTPAADAARLCAAFFAPSPAKVAGVTGSNGKTSVTWFARQLMELAGKDAVSAGTLGLIPLGLGTLPDLTSPDPVSLHRAIKGAANKGFDYLVLEASSHGLDQHRLDGLRFDVTAFTNLSQDHLDYHGDMAAYRAAKLRLLALQQPKGITIANADDAAFGGLDGWSYGQKGKEGRILIAEPTSNGLHLKTQDFDLELPLIGTFQGHNLICAWLIARALEVEAADHLAQVTVVPGRMEPVAQHKWGGLVLVDYAHTPGALISALTALRPHTIGRLICVFGAGGNRDRTKRPLMGKAAHKLADLNIITDDNPRFEDPALIRSTLVKACPDGIEIGDRRTAIAEALSSARGGDLVLIAGKGHEIGQTQGSTTRPFDDRDVVRELANQSQSWTTL